MKRRGIALLKERLAALPALLRRALDAGGEGFHGEIQPGARIRVAGSGSSRAQARLLAALLCDTGWRAAEEPLLGLRARSGEVLIVISQGLSAAARRTLSQQPPGVRLVLLSALDAENPSTGAEEPRAWLRQAQAAGLQSFPLPVPPEFGTLVRVQGPIVGIVSAIRLAQALGWPGEIENQRLQGALDACWSATPPIPAADFGSVPLVLLGSGAYRDLLDNLSLKVAEMLWREPPPVHDPGEVAHGIFQQGHDGPRIWVAFRRPDAPDEAEALARLARMLPEHQRLVEIPASLPQPWCLLEHEILWTRALLEIAEAGSQDPAVWPGQGRDGPLYEWGADAPPPAPRALPRAPLESATSPRVAEAWSVGAGTVVVPLGSVEQHGAHLPLGTDTRIADALAERLCARLPEARRLRAVPFGMASEHLSFAGTLSVSGDTFERLLGDLVASLAGHGVREVVLFSAHGGNDPFLVERAERLAQRAEPASLLILRDPPAIAAALSQVAARDGVSAGQGGWHAGEYETSILLDLAPAEVVRACFAPGVVDPQLPAAEFFYPDLADHAPGGVVGDPRPADAARAEAYLEAWVDELERLYRSRASTSQQKGTKKA